MLVKTNKKDKNGRIIYQRIVREKQVAMCGNHVVNIPGKQTLLEEVTLLRVGHEKGVKLPDLIFGRYKKPIGQQRYEKSLLRKNGTK